MFCHAGSPMSYIDSRAPRSHFGLRGQAGGAASPSFKSLQGGDAAAREADNTKRTTAITLAVLGAGAVGLYFYARSGGIPEGTPQVFTTVEQCVLSGTHGNGVCEAQWNEASRVHDRAAPAYDSMAACEQAHGGGKCIRPATPEDAARAAKYIPMMGGYFFGRTADGTFRGVPLYNMAADGPANFRVAELQPKAPEAEPVAAASRGGLEQLSGGKLAGTETNLEDKAQGENRSGSSRTTILFIPGASAAAPAAAAAAAGAAGARGMTNPARPMGAAPSAAPAPATRGGFGTSARAGSGGGFSSGG